MKTLTLILALISFNAAAQQRHLTEPILESNSRKYETYRDSKSLFITVGDTIEFGSIVEDGKQYITVKKVDNVGTICMNGNNADNGYAVVRTIKCIGNKRKGYQAKVIVDGFDYIHNYYPTIEKAINRFEMIIIIRGNGY